MMTRLAGHLCGQWCRDAADGPFLWAIERPHHFDTFQRLQFNGLAMGAVPRMVKYTEHFPEKQFILQCRHFDTESIMANAGLAKNLHPALLLDRSGGRGIELTDFPTPHPYAPCGYAGGFGPDNLQSVLTTLTAMQPADKEFWVDMESNVRTDGKFDLAKVRRCLEIAKPFVKT